jgi:hypothetical protein
MRHYLVVANQSLTQPRLTETILACRDAGPSDFHLLVPATLTQAHTRARLTRAEATGLAQGRLHAALARLKALGVAVSGEVGGPSPVVAIGEILSRRSFDELIISTLPAGPSQWLRRGLPERVERLFNLPVTLVTPQFEAVAAGTGSWR